MKNNESKICIICGKPYIGYGNNAWPIKTGICCNDCNSNLVIPARIQATIRGDEPND